MNAIEIKDLRKSYPTGHIIRKRITALRGISFSVKKGETFGLLGHNGAGKTTTFKILTGLIFPGGGEVKILDKSPDDLEAKNSIGFLPENPYFYTYLTPVELLQFYGGLFNIERKKLHDRIEYLLDLLSLTKWKDTRIGKFSKGMLQRVGMAQALINDPEILILDEPMTGLDPVGRKELKNIILSLKEKGKTIIFSSHILSDVEMICDRVAILIRGRIVETGSIEELLVKRSTGYEIELTANAKEWVKNKGLEYSPSGSSIIVTLKDFGEAQKLLKEAVNEQLEILSFIPRRVMLEDLFMEEYRKYEKDIRGGS